MTSRRLRSVWRLTRDIRSLAALAGPIVVNQLGHIGMNTADTIMVGPLGPTALAAVGLGTALHVLGTVVTTGMIVGMSPLVSQAWGARDRLSCRRIFVQGCWLALLLSVPVMLFNTVGRELALLLGQEPEIADLTGRYMRALVWGLPPLLLFTAARQYLEGMGYVAAPMVITFIGLLVNIVANHVLIYGIGDVLPGLGLVGSGWATTIVRWAMLLVTIAYFIAHREITPLRDVAIRPEPVLLRRMTRIGAPIGAQFGLEVGLFSFAAVMMGWLGTIELAAHQVTINIAATTFMVALGTSMAGSIRVGHHIGAGRPRALRRAVVATYVLSTGVMAIFALLFVLMPRVLIGLYTADEAVLHLGSRLLLVAAAFQIFDGGQVAGMSVLRGAADTHVPMIVAAIGYWGLGMPIAYLLAFRTDLNAVGVWLGLSVGLAVVAVLLVLRVRTVIYQVGRRAHEATGQRPARSAAEPMSRPVNVAGYEDAARSRLPRAVYDYYAGGAEEEHTLRGNRSAFGHYAFRPRVFVDVGDIDLRLRLLDHDLALPILLAPAAFQRLAHDDGELATARAARAAGTVLVASSLSNWRVEEIAAAAPGPLWLQLYIFRDRSITEELVRRAEAAGCTAVCVTASVPVQGNRERDAHNAFTLPDGIEMANFRGLAQAQLPDADGSRLRAYIAREFEPSLTWSALDWLSGITRMKVLVKGVMTPDDARLAVEHGAAGVIVSNHGGRQLDGCEPTLFALPRVAEAVADRVPVLMDGGIRRGTDVVKALLLGARAVMVARPFLWGLAVDGEAGVLDVLRLLEAELRRTLALIGAPSLARLDGAQIVRLPAPFPPG